MVKALIITNNIHFIKVLSTEINTYNLNVKISGISTNPIEALSAVKSFGFDLILLDKDLKKEFDASFLELYSEIIVVLSLKEPNYILTKTSFKKIVPLIKQNDAEVREARIVKELTKLGYNLKYKGTKYLIDTILQMYDKQHSMVDNLQSVIYPIVAKKYNKTVHNIKSSIGKATECMYYECDSQKLADYFGFSNDEKPTVKQVIFTVINKI